MSWISRIVAVVAIAGLGLTSATAQEFFVGAGGPVPLSPVVAAPVVADGMADGPLVTGPAHYYSYYVEFPAPARTYVPYGASDTFTFLGQAYGHAYDRWTWPVMSNASPGLGRYYQLLH